MEVKYVREPTEEEVSKVPKWSGTSERVLEIIKTKCSVSTVDLSRLTGYKPGTISAQISILRRMGLIENIPSKISNSPVIERFSPSVNRQPSIESLHEGKENVEMVSKPFFEADSIRIFNDDILKIDALKDETIDLIVTSPPYDVDIKYENYNDSIPYVEYLEFTGKWLSKCYDAAKADGRLCLNIPLDKNKGGQQSVCADITTTAKNVGWKYHATIIWNEQNISRRTAWGSWLSASAPFVIAPVEVIVVMYKKRWEKIHKGKSDIARDEFIEWTNGVWNFSGESRSRIGHPAPFPVELPRRCIKLFSFAGDVVLDPFLGSGTTLIACLETNRTGIGVEINRSYCELAVKRLKEHGILQKKLDEMPQIASSNVDKL